MKAQPTRSLAVTQRLGGKLQLSLWRAGDVAQLVRQKDYITISDNAQWSFGYKFGCQFFLGRLILSHLGCASFSKDSTVQRICLK
jgi:hypothetical protein